MNRVASAIFTAAQERITDIWIIQNRIPGLVSEWKFHHYPEDNLGYFARLLKLVADGEDTRTVVEVAIQMAYDDNLQTGYQVQTALEEWWRDNEP